MKKNIPFYLVAGAACMVTSLAMWKRNTLIIHLGVRGYATLQLVLSSLFGFLLGVSIYFTVAELHRKKREAFLARRETERKKENAQSDVGMLSADGSLSDRYVKESLLLQAKGKWSPLSMQIDIAAAQLDTMNSYQYSLSSLLSKNSAEALSDAEGILDRVEQQMLGNVRNILNYMEIFGNSDADVAILDEKLKECSAENARLLDAVKDFLVSVTGFLNNQGSSGNESLQTIEEFKALFMENGESEETFLKLS